MDRKNDSINNHAVTDLAKDLTKDYPRSPRETLCGYVIAARTLDKRGLVMEMVLHQFLEPSNEERTLNLLAIDGPKPPIGDCHVIGIDHIMTQCVLPSD